MISTLAFLFCRGFGINVEFESWDTKWVNSIFFSIRELCMIISISIENNSYVPFQIILNIWNNFKWFTWNWCCCGPGWTWPVMLCQVSITQSGTKQNHDKFRKYLENHTLNSQKKHHRARYRMSVVNILEKKISFNSLGPSDAICWHWSVSTLAQEMAYCLTAPSHCLNQCWLVINGFCGICLRAIFTEIPSIYKQRLKITLLQLLPHLSGTNELTHCPLGYIWMKF